MLSFKVLSILALIAVSNAGYIGAGYGGYQGGEHLAYAGHAGYAGYAGHDDHADYYAHPKYTFDYSVKDPHTGDNKNQWESRDGDAVKGSYSVAEADGTTRIVEYTADKHNGFNAIVKRVGHAIHPQIYGHGHEQSAHYAGHY